MPFVFLTPLFVHVRRLFAFRVEKLLKKMAPIQPRVHPANSQGFERPLRRRRYTAVAVTIVFGPLVSTANKECV